MATGRPRLPDDQLKYKRPPEGYKLKSRYTGVQLDIPTPSEADLAKWAKIVERCRVLVLTNASCHDGAKKNMLELRLSGKPPKGFPVGRIVQKHEDGSQTRKYNAEQILMWLWERKLAPWNAGMLYRMRREVMQGWAATMGGGASEMLFERELESLI
jgi:hypothetical protein